LSGELLEKEKGFITLILGVNITKLLFFIPYAWQNKSQAIIFSVFCLSKLMWENIKVVWAKCSTLS